MANPDQRDPPGLVTVANALLKALNLSVRVVSPSAGLLPQQAFALLNGAAWQRLRTWERTVRALGAEISVIGRIGHWEVPLAKVEQQDLDRAFDTLARRYKAAAEAMESRASLEGVLRRTKEAMNLPYRSATIIVDGLASIVQHLAAQKGLRATHLTLVAGISDIASRRFTEGEEWPALAHIHSLFAALGCSIVAKSGQLVIKAQQDSVTPMRRLHQPQAAPKPDPEIKRAIKAKAKAAAKARTRSPRVEGATRSRLSREEIIEHLKQGLSQSLVATKAGISRQRVSFIASEEGLAQRSDQRLQDAKQGLQTLRKLSID